MFRSTQVIPKVATATAILVALSLTAEPSFAQKVVTDAAATTQRATQHAQNLENWFSEMANWEQQLNTALESTEWLQKTYAAAQFLGGSQQFTELLDQVSKYKSLVEAVSNDIEQYSRNGLMSFSQLQYSTSLLSQGLRCVSGTLTTNFKEAITSNGMTVAERFSLLCGTSEKLKKEYWKLMLLNKKNKEKAAATAARTSERMILASMTMPSIEPPLSMMENNIENVLNDSYVNRLYADAQAKQSRYFGSGNTTERTASEGRGHRNNAIAIASYLIGIAAALLLAIAFERRNKGDRQSHDALYKIGIGLLFALVALQLVSKYFSF